MRAYVSVSYSNRKLIDLEIDTIMQVLNKFSISSMVFVDQYKFDASQEQEMMTVVMAEIDKSDLLLAEVSDKGIGIGIEVGFAKAKGKPVIYLRHEGSEHSTTVSGISDYHVIYSDLSNLQQKLAEVVTKLKLNGLT